MKEIQKNGEHFFFKYERLKKYDVQWIYVNSNNAKNQ